MVRDIQFDPPVIGIESPALFREFRDFGAIQARRRPALLPAIAAVGSKRALDQRAVLAALDEGENQAAAVGISLVDDGRESASGLGLAANRGRLERRREPLVAQLR